MEATFLENFLMTHNTQPPLVIISPQLGVSPVSNSGGEVYDREALEHLTQAGAHVHIILPRQKLFTSGGYASVTRVIFKRIVPPYLYNILLLGPLISLYKKTNASIIRIHSPYFTGLGILFFRLFFRRPKVILSYLHVENFPLWRRIDRFVLARVDHIFTISECTKRELIADYSIAPDKITVTYCGIDKKYQPQPKNKQLMEKFRLTGKQVLLYFGGLKPRKNLPFLLDVLTELNNKNTVLFFAGSGSERALLEAKAKELGILDQIRFSGYIEEADKVAIYNLADIFVFPTEREGFGMAVGEAMACELPVVASKVTSLPEVVLDTQTGLLPAFHDLTAWKHAIETLLNEPDLRQAMGKLGREHVRASFSWEKLAQTQLRIMQKLIKD